MLAGAPLLKKGFRLILVAPDALCGFRGNGFGGKSPGYQSYIAQKNTCQYREKEIAQFIHIITPHIN
jgi:hypothetical protein